MMNSSNEDQDQRKSTSTEDSTAMTIEFLRARLLSERSVSRTARQRADELGKRVAELEEQLKTVSLQRKKAEKATVDVLAILENHGITDVSEEFDSSSSDQEATLFESKVGNNSVKGEEASASVKVRRNNMEAFSGSEIESSPLSGRSLSWKSGKDSPHSLEKKYTDSSRRRRHSFSSPRRVGKSCRQIRHRETRSAVEESQIDSSMIALQSNGAATCSEDFSNCSDIGPETPREGSENREQKDFLEGPVSGVVEKQRGVNNGHYLNGHREDKDMERALEHQAQLIGRYEAEEKAQREWEEKFRENNSCALDSCDPGNHSDVTEERDEIKSLTPPVGMITSQDQDAKLETQDVCFSKESNSPNDFQPPPHVDMGRLPDQKCSDMIASESSPSEFAFPMAKGKQDDKSSENYPYPPLHNSINYSHSPASPGSHSADVSSSRACSRLGEEAASGSGKELALMPHETSDKLGSVLEALQQAKSSLKQKLNSLPLIEDGSVGKAIEPSAAAMRTRDRLDIPVGCAGLFRLPTDLQFEATPKANILGLSSQLSSAIYSPETGAGNFLSSPYMEFRSISSAGDRFLTVPTGPSTEIRSGLSTWTPVFDGLPSFDRYPHLNPQLSSSLPPSRSRYTHLDPRLSTGLPPSSSRYTHLDPRLSTGLPPSSSRYTPLDPHLSAGVPPSSNRYTHLDPYLSTDLPPSSKYSYPPYPFYSDQMRPMPSNEGLSRPLPSGDPGIPPATPFSFNDDHIRPNMYR